MKLKEKNKNKKLNYIVLVIGIIVFSIISVLYLKSNLVIRTEKVEIINEINQLQEVKPSYEYLKSITVYITGKIPTREEDGVTVIGQQWSGTGTIIKIDNEYTYILTNAHVVNEEENPILFVKDGLAQKEAEIVAIHDNSEIIDLAVIKVKGLLRGKRTVKGITVASPQDKLYLVGHHLGRPYIYGEGVFAGYDEIYDIIQIPTLFGNSGSGICNKNGELIGVIFAINRIGYFDVDVAHGLAISSLNVQIFLNKLGLL